MSQLARLLGTFACGHVLEHQGTSFEFRRLDQAAKVALEAAYFRRCRESVYAMKDGLSEEAYDRALARVSDRYARGELAFPLGEALQYYTTYGLPELAAVLTGKDRADCEDLIAVRWQDVFHVIWCVLCESQPALKKKLLTAEATPGQQAQAMALLAEQLSLTRPNGTT